MKPNIWLDISPGVTRCWPLMLLDGQSVWCSRAWVAWSNGAVMFGWCGRVVWSCLGSVVVWCGHAWLVSLYVMIRIQCWHLRWCCKWETGQGRGQIADWAALNDGNCSRDKERIGDRLQKGMFVCVRVYVCVCVCAHVHVCECVSQSTARKK